jgi:hypothetical protein
LQKAATEFEGERDEADDTEHAGSSGHSRTVVPQFAHLGGQLASSEMVG